MSTTTLIRPASKPLRLAKLIPAKRPARPRFKSRLFRHSLRHAFF
ncbi:MAG TPA: hypothetical protein VGM64_16545 [Lacunisphaera sp.]